MEHSFFNHAMIPKDLSIGFFTHAPSLSDPKDSERETRKATGSPKKSSRVDSSRFEWQDVLQHIAGI